MRRTHTGWVTSAVLAVVVAALAFWLTRDDDPLGAWHGPNGAPVSEDVVTAYVGSSHCDWDDAWILQLSAQVTGDEAGRGYFVRDPDNVIGTPLRSTYEADAAIPGEAVDTGYATDDVRLWLAADSSSAFLQFAGHVERWPRARGDLLCG